MRPPSLRLAASCLVLAAMASASGCGDMLPQEGLIITDRVIAIQTAVTVALPDVDPDPAAPPRAQALPFEVVRVTPYMVGPTGPIDPADLDPVWIACELAPGGGLFACLDAALPLKLDEIPDCAVSDFSDLMGDEIPEFTSPCVFSRQTEADFTVPLSAGIFIGADFELTMISGPTQGTSTADCAAPLLDGEYELPDDCIFAVQRLSLGPIERFFLLMAEFGALPPEIELPDPADVRDGDRNPRIERISVAITHEDGTMQDEVDVADGDTISAALGDTLRVTTVSPEDDLQFYDIAVNNGASKQEEQEAYQGAWLRTWGRMLSGSSDDPESFNEWTLSPGSQDEDETPPNGEAHLYYVVKDGRQGVNWWHLRVQIEDEGA